MPQKESTSSCKRRPKYVTSGPMSQLSQPPQQQHRVRMTRLKKPSACGRRALPPLKCKSCRWRRTAADTHHRALHRALWQPGPRHLTRLKCECKQILAIWMRRKGGNGLKSEQQLCSTWNLGARRPKENLSQAEGTTTPLILNKCRTNFHLSGRLCVGTPAFAATLT